MVVTAPSTDALYRLSAQRRVMNWLYWWRLEEWQRTPFVQTLEDDAGAMIAIPIGCGPLDAMSCRATIAWLRWCALADGASAGRTMRRLLARAHAQLAPFGVRELWALTLTSEWLHSYMTDLGFQLAEHIITFVRDDSDLPDAASEAHIQPFSAGRDLDALVEVDAAAFPPPWRLRRADLHRLMETAAVHDLAWIGQDVVGYVCALHDGYEEAHIVRLAVAPAWQRQGVGRALLVAAMRALAQDGVARFSLNTMASNTAAQALYRQLGFVRERRRGFAWRKVFEEEK